MQPHNAKTGRIHSGVSLRCANLSKVAKLIAVEALQVLFLEEDIDTLLDVAYLRGKTMLDLLDSLGHKLSMLHGLARLHDTNNGRLKKALVMNC